MSGEWKTQLLAEHAARELESKAEEKRQYAIVFERVKSDLLKTLTGLGVPVDAKRVEPGEHRGYAKVNVDDVTFWGYGGSYIYVHQACARCGRTVESTSIDNRRFLAHVLADFPSCSYHECTPVASAPDPATIRQDCTPAEARLLAALKDWLVEES